MPVDYDDVLNYVSDADPNGMPTKVLVELAQKMKERRQFLYEAPKA
jgi:hypothetical protein